MICEGCKSPIGSMAECYGPPGDTFCLRCWLEDRPWIMERRQLLNEIFKVEIRFSDSTRAQRRDLFDRLKELQSEIDRLTRAIGTFGGSYELKWL